MNQCCFAVLLFIVYLIFAGHTANAQRVETNEERTKLFTQLARDERAVAVCERLIRDEQIREFGKPLPRVSGHCLSGCPIRVAMPRYPEIARRLRKRGDVYVEAIVNEQGHVVYAKLTKGSGLFHKAALDAAYLSLHQPKVTCDKRPIKFRWTIKYRFSPEM